MALANQENLEGADPHEEIVRLEEHTEELAAKIGSCRKFILAARIAVAGGAVVLAAMPRRCNPVRSRVLGSGGRLAGRRYCCMGFK
jgi:hypothetical protein